MNNNNGIPTTPEIRLEIPDDESTVTGNGNERNNNTNRPTILSILSTNNQQLIDNVIAPFIDGYQSFLDQQQPSQLSQTSPSHNNPLGAAPSLEQIPPQNPPPPSAEDQNEDQYLVVCITIVKTIIQYIPIVLILVLKCTVDNFQVIVDIFIFHVVTWYLNLKFKAEVAKKAQRSKARLTILLFYILAMTHFQVTYFIDDSTRLGLLLIYDDTNVPLSTLFYQVILTDCILKIISIFLKICVNILPLKWIHMKQRSRSYAFIENFIQFYRCLAPVHIWLDYFFFAYTGWQMIFGGLFSAFYLAYKGFEIVKRFKPARKSLLALFHNVNHGRTPTQSELESSEQQCPICHDHFTDPVILKCTHIFCESCVTTWFTNEQTCPLCRAKVADSPTWQCGSTSLFYQVY